jgi:hypothetical protein
MLPGAALAQDSLPPAPTLRAGDKVWVSSPDWLFPSLEGWLILLGPGYVTIRSDSTYKIPVSEIRRFEKSIGRDPRVMFGVPIGTAVLGAVLVPALITRPAKCVANVGDPDCSGELPYGLVGALGGMIVGVLLANALSSERWVEIPLERVAFGPIPGGVEVRMRVRVRVRF